MSTLSPSRLPAGAIRTGFEAAAEAHAAARRGGAARQVEAAAALPPSPGSTVEAAIADAAARTGVDFTFLLAQAEVESALDPAARARSSSATGLYQFIESTWLDTMRKHAGRFGLGHLAQDIAVTPSGSAYVADPARREAILALRADPEIAALMAAGLAEDNRAELAPVLGRAPDHAELYLAHFLGAKGASRFLSALQADPSQSAPPLFARPAAANRAIFYRPDGAPRSLAQVMGVIAGKMERALDRAGSAPAAQIARRDPAPRAAAPYLIADEAVFIPDAAPSLARAPAVSPPPRVPISQVLGATFGNDPVAPAQVRRAYDRLKALGL